MSINGEAGQLATFIWQLVGFCPGRTLQVLKHDQKQKESGVIIHISSSLCGKWLQIGLPGFSPQISQINEDAKNIAHFLTWYGRHIGSRDR